MRCPNCNEEIPEDKKFCGHCGHRLIPQEPAISPPEPEDFDEQAPTIVEEPPVQPTIEEIDESAPSTEPEPEDEPALEQIACPSCGTQNPSGSRFCNSCAANLHLDEAQQDIVETPPVLDEIEEPAQKVSEPLSKAPAFEGLRGLPKWAWGVGLVVLAGLVVLGVVVVPRIISPDVASSPLVEEKHTVPSEEQQEPTPTLEVPAVSDYFSEDDEKEEIQDSSSEVAQMPSFISEVLQNATITATEDFYTLPDDWHKSSSLISHDSANNLMNIPGGNDGIHLGAPYEIAEGEAILILFQFDKQGDVLTMLETGFWETSSYRRWGMFSAVGYFRSDTYLGADWRGEPILEGNILAKPDTWYYLLLAVGRDGNFAMKVWERDDITKNAEYWELDESQWENKKWSFLLSNWGGDVTLDSLSVIEFSDLRELSQAEIHFWTGKDYNREWDLQAAFDEYSQAVALDDQVPYYFRKRGVMSWVLDDHDTAFSDHFAALEIDPDDYWVLRNLSMFYRDEGNFDQAYSYADRVIQVAPELHDGYWIMADAEFYLAEDPQSAVIDYSLAIERYAGDPSLFRDRCIAYNALEEYSSAFEDCSRCLELNPEYDGCYWDRGWANDGLGNTSAAVSDFENYLDMVAPDVCPECQEDAQQYIDQNK
ncbi:MAG: zinc ribbon domain-containing protein [Chloroflexi bacterium]|nr:zinc ribbon domain-containing protein [Chloroflexota bacterium]MBL7163588.1 zinc ribbon domain-containing protein [Anaerolineales bacterium]